MTPSSNIQIHLCKDGSHTLYSNRFRQYYHNPNGAVAESRHVFFETPGWLSEIDSEEPFHLFEMGFGTGLNLLLLLEELKRNPRKGTIVYHAVEAFPLSLEQAMKLNYRNRLDLPNCGEVLATIFRNLQPGLNEIRICNQLVLRLFIGRFEAFPEPEHPYRLIFFDPFSPDVNPELWQVDVFRKLADWSAPDVLLTTYGAASAARAAMAAGGWSVTMAQGALGKREMTLASTDPNRVAGWKRVNEQRLIERLEAGEFS